jgi:hypothetical protein
MPIEDPEKRKAYHKAYDKKYYQDNKEKLKKKNNDRRLKIRAWFKDYKRTLKCNRCPQDHPATLEFHHEDEDLKEHEISNMINQGFSIKRIKKEIEKCEILCANCHKIHHLGKFWK